MHRSEDSTSQCQIRENKGAVSGWEDDPSNLQRQSVCFGRKRRDPACHTDIQEERAKWVGVEEACSLFGMPG